MSALHRMADANLNRAREALRCLEDVARFGLTSEALCRRAKDLRHALQSAIDSIPGAALSFTASRDAHGDPGTSAIGALERTRAGLAGVAAAAAARSGEALRALEEALKAIDADAAARVEAIRYRAYDLAGEIVLACGTGRAKQWRICLLLTESLCKRPWREVLSEALAAGVDSVQVREKSLPGAALLDRAREVIDAARPRGAAVIVNDRPDIAMAAGADGVHLGEEDLPIRDVRALGGSLLIGASTHDLGEAERCLGADYCGVGAMFPTAQKPDRTPSGVAYLRAFVERWPLRPHLAIGGISPENIEPLVDAGCRGVAVSQCICGAERPGAAAAALLRAFARLPAESRS